MSTTKPVRTEAAGYTWEIRDARTLDSEPSAPLALVQIAALLGSNTEWDSAADYLEMIAAILRGPLRDAGAYSVSVQDDDALAYWREIADEQGIDHDEGSGFASW